MNPKTPENIDDYFGRFPLQVQRRLMQMRSTIQKVAPQAVEMVSYGIPTFALNGSLVYFAAFKNHIGFYPHASGIAAFKAELKPYKFAKGSVQFPFDEPLPLDLIRRIVQFRVEENLARAKKK